MDNLLIMESGKVKWASGYKWVNPKIRKVDQVT